MNNSLIFKTSANMDEALYHSLSDAAASFGIKNETIFKDLVFLLLSNSKFFLKYSGLTEYQDHSPDDWVTFYYTLNPDEIEILNEAKQHFKISISKMAFIAFVVFWDLLLFRYKERILTYKERILKNSYIYFYKKTQIYREKYLIRMNIKQKE